MTADLEVAYLGIEVADPAAFAMFFTDVVGLVPGESTTDGAQTWRNDDRVHRILVHEGPANDVVYLGLEVPSLDAFDRAVTRGREAGAVVTDGTDADLAAAVRSGWRWSTRRGAVPAEIVHGLAGVAEPFDSPLVPGGFVTKDEGFGHVVFVTGVLDAAYCFTREVLGFVQSDWMETDLGRNAADGALLSLPPASTTRSRARC